MRILRGVAIVVILMAAASARAADDSCAAGCDTTLAACQAKAASDAAACREKAHEPCKAWCPCDQFIGAAHFACLLECQKCEAEAETIAAKCPEAARAAAPCAETHRRCMQRCAADG